jgi:hypothetical protein
MPIGVRTVHRGQVLDLLQSVGHGQQMAQGDPILFRRAEIGVFGKVGENRGVQILDEAAIDSNAD